MRQTGIAISGEFLVFTLDPTNPRPRETFLYFKAENLVLRARSESVGFAEIVNKDRMFGTKAQRHKGTE